MADKIVRQSSMSFQDDRGNRTSHFEVLFADGRQFARTIYTDSAKRRTSETTTVDQHGARTTEVLSTSNAGETRHVTTFNHDVSSEEIIQKGVAEARTTERRMRNQKGEVHYERIVEDSTSSRRLTRSLLPIPSGHIEEQQEIVTPGRTGSLYEDCLRAQWRNSLA
jgi:hypothetical protein